MGELKLYGYAVVPVGFACVRACGAEGWEGLHVHFAWGPQIPSNGPGKDDNVRDDYDENYLI